MYLHNNLSNNSFLLKTTTILSIKFKIWEKRLQIGNLTREWSYWTNKSLFLSKKILIKKTSINYPLSILSIRLRYSNRKHIINTKKGPKMMILRVQISYNVFTFLELKRKNNIQKEKEIRVETIARYLKYLLSL